MNIGLKAGLVVVSLIALSSIIFAVAKKKLNIKYSIVWIVWAVVILVLALFPEIIDGVAELLGIAMPVNALFLIMMALLYFLTFYVFIMISKHNEEIIKLTYENSLLRKDIEEIKKK